MHSALVASLLDLARVNDFEQLMARPVFADISLRSPAGEMLLGKAPPARIGPVSRVRQTRRRPSPR